MALLPVQGPAIILIDDILSSIRLSRADSTTLFFFISSVSFKKTYLKIWKCRADIVGNFDGVKNHNLESAIHRVLKQ